MASWNSLRNNLWNLGVEDEIKLYLKDYGFDIESFYETEPDAGLGNGGLGRLSSCFMDSLTTLSYPATGFSIRYEFGIFKQVIIGKMSFLIAGLIRQAIG